MILTQEQKDQLEAHFTADKSVEVCNVWTIGPNYMRCYSGCCEDYFSDIKEALEYVEIYANNFDEDVTFE